MGFPENYASYQLVCDADGEQGLQVDASTLDVQVGYLEQVASMEWMAIDNGNGRWALMNNRSEGLLDVDGSVGEGAELTSGSSSSDTDWNIQSTSKSGHYKVFYKDTSYALTGGSGKGYRTYLSSSDDDTQYFRFDSVGGGGFLSLKEAKESVKARHEAKSKD